MCLVFLFHGGHTGKDSVGHAAHGNIVVAEKEHGTTAHTTAIAIGGGLGHCVRTSGVRRCHGVGLGLREVGGGDSTTCSGGRWRSCSEELSGERADSASS